MNRHARVQEESIYNLIPKECEEKEKSTRFERMSLFDLEFLKQKLVNDVCRVSLKHDGTVKMARLLVPFVSPVVKLLVLEQSLLI